jgi:hypothetical protein
VPAIRANEMAAGMLPEMGAPDGHVLHIAEAGG